MNDLIENERLRYIQMKPQSTYVRHKIQQGKGINNKYYKVLGTFDKSSIALLTFLVTFIIFKFLLFIRFRVS